MLPLIGVHMVLSTIEMVLFLIVMVLMTPIFIYSIYRFKHYVKCVGCFKDVRKEDMEVYMYEYRGDSRIEYCANCCREKKERDIEEVIKKYGEISDEFLMEIKTGKFKEY